MFKKRNKLGVRIAIICSVLTIITAGLSLTITALLYTEKMRETTFTLCESGMLTIEARVQSEVKSLELLSKTITAMGAGENTDLLATSLESMRRSESDFIGLAKDGKITWTTDNAKLPENFAPATGLFSAADDLVCTYCTKDLGGYSYVVGTNLSNTSFVDDLKAETDCEISLFLNDVRYNTTILNDKGNRIVGEKMSASVWKTIQSGKSFQDRIGINGKSYFVHYEPMNDANGQIIGSYFAGYSADKYSKAVVDSILFTVIICVLLAAVVIVVLCVIMKKSIEKPISALIPECDDIKNINLNNVNSKFAFNNDEIGMLADSLIESKQTINAYVQDIVAVLDSMTEGDFSVEPSLKYKGDFISIENAFREIRSQLGEIISNVTLSAENVSIGAEQMAEGTQSLAEGTQRQAATIDELSSSVSGISEHVNKTAQAAQTASEISMECSNIMQQRTYDMKNLIEAMDIVEKKSEDIANVIKAIEDIAFQTNILALNASIEAGKGFAVVATEVGTLAARSAESANSTKTIIDSTLEAVAKSIEIARDAAKAIEDVTEKSRQASELVSEIAVSSGSQAKELEQATLGINDISSVIQQNSSTAEQSAASCEELSAQSKIMQEQVNRLKV